MAVEHRNRHCEAHNYNNLANLYFADGQFARAHEAVKEAIKIGRELNQIGCVAHFLDTKANIYLEEGKPGRALRIINLGLKLSVQGENYLRLTEHLWTKCRILFALKDREEDAFIVFGEIQKIARDNIGEKIVKRYARLMKEQTHALSNKSLEVEVHEFEKALIKRALINTKNNISAAERLLGFRKRGALSWKMNHKYQDLYTQLDIPKKIKTVTVKAAGKKLKEKPTDNYKEFKLKRSEIRREKITKLETEAADYIFDSDIYFEGDRIETYFFNNGLMEQFGMSKGAAVAVVPTSRVEVGTMVIVRDDDDLYLGCIKKDEMFDVNYITTTSGHMLPVDTKVLLGEPVGYCLIDYPEQKIFRFHKIPFTL